MGCNPNPPFWTSRNRVAMASHERELPHPDDWHDDHRGGHNDLRAGHYYFRMPPVSCVPSTFTNQASGRGEKGDDTG